MTAIIITFGLVGCWCLMAHNYPIAAILRDICRTEQRQTRTIAVDLCHRGKDDEWLPQ